MTTTKNPVTTDLYDANHIKDQQIEQLKVENEHLKYLLTQVDKYGKAKLVTELDEEINMLKKKLEMALKQRDDLHDCYWVTKEGVDGGKYKDNLELDSIKE